MRPSIVPCQKVQERRRYALVFQEYPGGGNRARETDTMARIPRQDLLTHLAHALATDALPPVLKSDGTPGLANFPGILALNGSD